MLHTKCSSYDYFKVVSNQLEYSMRKFASVFGGKNLLVEAAFIGIILAIKDAIIVIPRRKYTFWL